MTEQHEEHAHLFERGTDGPKVILVGVDGSDSSMRAAAYASGLARRQHALLAVVYVQPVLAAGAALGAPVMETTDEIAEDLVGRSGRRPSGSAGYSRCAGSSTPSAATPTPDW